MNGPRSHLAGYPVREKGLADLGELAALLAYGLLDFRVETASSEAGFERAVVTIYGAVGVGDVEQIIQWTRGALGSRHVSFPVTAGDVIRVTLTWRGGDDG